jgi:hypothetical protein
MARNLENPDPPKSEDLGNLEAQALDTGKIPKVL